MEYENKFIIVRNSKIHGRGIFAKKQIPEGTEIIEYKGDKITKKESEITELDVWLGKKGMVKVYTKNDIYKTIPKARKKYLKVIIDYNGPVKAPIKKDDILGKLKISYKDKIIDEHDLLAFENVKKLNIFSRLIRSINYLIWGDV